MIEDDEYPSAGHYKEKVAAAAAKNDRQEMMPFEEEDIGQSWCSVGSSAKNNRQKMDFEEEVGLCWCSADCSFHPIDKYPSPGNYEEKLNDR